MWDGHPGRIPTAEHRIVLNQKGVRLVHSSPYRAGHKAKEFSATEIDLVLQEDVLEPTPT